MDRKAFAILRQSADRCIPRFRRTRKMRQHRCSGKRLMICLPSNKQSLRMQTIGTFHIIFGGAWRSEIYFVEKDSMKIILESIISTVSTSFSSKMQSRSKHERTERTGVSRAREHDSSQDFDCDGAEHPIGRS